MVTVKDLVDKNPMMLTAVYRQKSTLNRLAGNDHWHMIRDYADSVTDQERTISTLVQTMVFGISVGITASTMKFAASRVGSTYWQVASAFVIPGMLYGAFYSMNPVNEIKYTADIYSCYQTRFKVLQPLHHLAINCSLGAIVFFALQKFPKLAYVNAAGTSFIISSYIGAAFRSAVEHFIDG